MKRPSLNILLMAAAFAVGTTACQQPAERAKQEAEPATQEEQVADAAEEAHEETMHEEDDKSKRPSPPVEKVGAIAGANVKINYGAPSVKGRTIWGDLVPYDQVWRTGANEATTIELDKDVMVNGEKLAAGRYAVFTIPTEGDWTVIFNSEPNQWGAYDYSAEKDVLRVTATPNSSEEVTEVMDISVDGEAGNITIGWEHLSVAVAITAAEA